MAASTEGAAIRQASALVPGLAAESRSGPITLDPLDCLSRGMVSPSENPSLPFYQPRVEASNENGRSIDDVVRTWPDTNRFNVYDRVVADVTPSPSEAICKDPAPPLTV